MKKPMITITALAALINLSASFATELPEGEGVIQIDEAGTYTLSADRTIGRLVVNSPTGTAAERTVTIFQGGNNTLTVNGNNNQFDVANHYNDIWFKGGTWNFSSYFYIGSENSSSAGKDAYRRLYVDDGAQISANRVAVNWGTGGSELYVSNATLTAKELYVQNASAVTSSRTPNDSGKLFVGKNGVVTLSGNLYIQASYTSGNSYHAGYAEVAGEGAELTAAFVQMGNSPLTKSTVGTRFIIKDGASVNITDTLNLGRQAYTYYPKLYDVLSVDNATFTAKVLDINVGSNVCNEVAAFTNSTVNITSSLRAGMYEGTRNAYTMFKNSTVNIKELYEGYAADTCSNKVEFADSTVTLQNLYGGYGQGSHDNTISFNNCTVAVSSSKFYAGSGQGAYNNLIAFYNCKDVEIPSGTTWSCVSDSSAHHNTILFSNTVVRTNREVVPNGVSNRVVFAGENAEYELALKQRDIMGGGSGCLTLITDHAMLSTASSDVSSCWWFKNGFNNEIRIDNGASAYLPTLVLGKVTTSGVTTGNRLVVASGAYVHASGETQVNGTNTWFVLNDATYENDGNFTVGITQEDSNKISYPSHGCGVEIAGSSAMLNLAKTFLFTEGSGSVLKFTLGATAYSWKEERTAPIQMMGSKSYKMTMYEDSVLTADVSALGDEARGSAIKLIDSPSVALAIPDSVITAANTAANGEYVFSLGDSGKSLYIMVTPRPKKGFLLEWR